MKARTPTPPWTWRLAAMGAGMAAAGLVGKAVNARQRKARSSPAESGQDQATWPAALVGAGVAAIAAAIARRLAQRAVTRAWTRRVNLTPK